VQDGFGWTNGVVSAMMTRYGITDRDLSDDEDRAPAP
jgi:hypothetical protein